MGVRALMREGGALAYRTIRRPQRQRALDRALSAGMPAWLEPPLRYYITGKLDPAGQAASDTVERRRAALAAQTSVELRTAMGREFTVSRFATETSAPRQKGTVLYLLAQHSGAQTIIELGSCVGVSGAYLAAAAPRRLISIEGSLELAGVARETIQGIKPDAEIHAGLFDDVLPRVLPDLSEGIDLAWIDGHHERDPTLRYLETLKPHLNRDAVVLFDDITWSREMRETWGVLRSADGFRHAVDLGEVGLGVWGVPGATPTQWNMTLITGREPLRDRPSW